MKMPPRDYFLFGISLFLVIPFSVADSLTSEGNNSNSSNTESSWVCDLGHTTLGTKMNVSHSYGCCSLAHGCMMFFSRCEHTWRLGGQEHRWR